MKNRLPWWMTLFAALALAVPAAWAQDADAKLSAFFKGYLDATFRLRPLQATSLGDHRYDNLIDNLTPQSRAVWLDQTRQTLSDLPRQVDYAKLSRDGQIDFEILRHELETESG